MPDHGRLPGTLQDLGGGGTVEQRDQAQKSGLAHTVVAHRQNTAAWVQLRDPPRRVAVAGVPDVDGDDAAKLMGHDLDFPRIYGRSETNLFSNYRSFAWAATNALNDISQSRFLFLHILPYSRSRPSLDNFHHAE